MAGIFIGDFVFCGACDWCHKVRSVPLLRPRASFYNSATSGVDQSRKQSVKPFDVVLLRPPARPLTLLDDSAVFKREPCCRHPDRLARKSLPSSYLFLCGFVTPRPAYSILLTVASSSCHVSLVVAVPPCTAMSITCGTYPSYGRR